MCVCVCNGTGSYIATITAHIIVFECHDDPSEIPVLFGLFACNLQRLARNRDGDNAGRLRGRSVFPTVRSASLTQMVLVVFPVSRFDGRTQASE